jgi:hypothetical protein
MATEPTAQQKTTAAQQSKIEQNRSQAIQQINQQLKVSFYTSFWFEVSCTAIAILLSSLASKLTTGRASANFCFQCSPRNHI